MLVFLIRACREIFYFLIELLIPSCARYLPRVDHFAPHEHAHFEGHFSRITLEDGSSCHTIFCSVRALIIVLKGCAEQLSAGTDS